MLKRYKGNPTLKPIPGSAWEGLMVYNAAAADINGKVHIIYRGQSVQYEVSKFGLAVSSDGFNIDERLPGPILENDPSIPAESLAYEDPRITVLGDRLHLTYTSYGTYPDMFTREEKKGEPPKPLEFKIPQLGMSSISLKDLLARNWNWEKTYLPLPWVGNKNCCIFPEKIDGKYVLTHRISPHIWIAYSDNLKDWHGMRVIMSPREKWEYYKIGGGAPPIRIDEGWLLIYHGVDNRLAYRLGLALLDYKDPTKVLMRSRIPLLEPEEEYEIEGLVRMVVYTCGAVLRGDTVFCYYGGADTVTGVATATVGELMDWLRKNS
jgi:predicted GH43/DUF377 family glycosyl hydrolase